MTPKFKAITTSGQWVEGSLAYMFEDQKNPCIMPKCYSLSRFSEDGNGKVIRTDDLMLGGFIEVIPETVCQFTGLHDKNGREIYSGDIVEFDDYGKKSSVVKWCNRSFGFVLTYPSYARKSSRLSGRGKLEITGSIHDHLVKQ